jgi:hypothetical protein
VDTTDRSVSDVTPQGTKGWGKLHEGSNKQVQASVSRETRHKLGFGASRCQRLFHYDMLAVLERQTDQLRMTVRRSDDDDNLRI